VTGAVPPIEEVLTLGELEPLHSPILLVGLTGWFDAGGVATTALAHVAPWDSSVIVGEIDPDPFYDFTQERPIVELVDGDTRHVSWPSNDFQVVRKGGAHDLVVLSGVEPHLAWRTYAGCVVRVVERLGCEAVVTVGAMADAVPHTRPPLVVGSTASPELASRLGLSSPTYQGITGLIGTLHVELEQRDIPTISLRVGVPHYLAHAEHPMAVGALVQHLMHVLGVPITVDLSDQVDRWSALHDESISEDVQLRSYVALLEAEYDRRAEAALRDADDLAARFEAFLREQRPDEND